MTNIDSYLNDIQQLIRAEDSPKLFKYLEENVQRFFSSPNISEVYQNIRSINVATSKSPIPKLIKAWLAFLCGDNVVLSSVMKTINEAELKDAHEYSLFCSLKAISGWNSSMNEREQYASLSVDILPKEDKSFYMANAQLTYGQMLSSQDKLRKAAEAFAQAYDLFDYNEMQFPAIVSRVNELLNRGKLGEFRSVIEICQNLLIMSAQFNTEKESAWNILHLPLGICYFELNRPHLAVNHLLQAKENIERLKLFHMHGLIEIYLFKAYHSLHDRISMEKTYSDSFAIYEPMHDRMGKIILSSIYLLMDPEKNDSLTQYNIQQLEMIYETYKEDTPSLAIQVLLYLKSKGLSHIITRKEVNNHLERLRYIGLIPDLHLFLVLNANLHQYEDNESAAISNLQEALAMFREFGISAAFNFLSTPMLTHLKRLDVKLWQVFANGKDEENAVEEVQLLSSREKEIMQLIAKGKTNKEVGDLLFIGVGTVKWHINHIFSKLQVSNRVQAIEKAKAMGELTNSISFKS